MNHYPAESRADESAGTLRREKTVLLKRLLAVRALI
jgi:hypothetical protein